MRQTLLILLLATNLFSFSGKVMNYFNGTQINQIISSGNEIWFGTSGKGILIFNKDTERWKSINTSNSEIKIDLIECFAFSKDYIWVGNTDGLIICDRKTDKWTVKKFSTGGVYGQWVRALAYDSLKEVLWVGRFINLTMYDIKNNRWKDFDLTKKKDNQTNNVKSLYLDNKQMLWVGTENGIHRVDTKATEKNNFEYYDTYTKGFSNNSSFASISCIDGDERNIYIGLAEFVTPEKPNYNRGGLYSLNQYFQWKEYNKKSGLISNGIYSVAVFGNFIIASTYEFIPTSKNEKGMGISVIDKTKKKILNIRAREGNFLNDKVKAIFFDGKYLWLGTSTGISRIDFFHHFL